MSPFDAEKYKRLLDGLEASEIAMCDLKTDNEKFRIDDEFFLKKYVKAYSVIKERLYDRFGDIIEVLTDYHANGSYEILNKNVTIVDYKEYAYMVRSTDLEKMEFSGDVRYVDQHAYEYLKKTKLFGGEILINKIGAPGRVYLMPSLNAPATLGMNLFMVKLKSDCEYNAKYIWAFFNSTFGQNIIYRKVNGTVPLTIDKDSVKSLYIPKMSFDFQNAVAKLVDDSFSNFNLSITIYDQSQRLLLSELGLNNFSLSIKNVAVKSLSDSFGSSGRLDAEYYQPKYEQIGEKIKSYSGGWTQIKNAYTLISEQVKISKEEYRYIEIGSVNVATTEINELKLRADELPANARTVLEENDLLISTVRPNRGAVAIVRGDCNDLIASSAFTVLRETGAMNIESLQVLLRTDAYKVLMLKYNVGTQYPVIKDEDVLNLIIPKLAENIQYRIAELINESFVLRKKSKELLEMAKRAVEVAIEQGEEIAEKLLAPKS